MVSDASFDLIVSPFQRTNERMHRQVSSELLGYWEGLRAGRLVPMRSEIDPRGIETCLDEAFIVERMATQIARFRIAGSHLGALLGLDVRGMPLTSLFTPSDRPAVNEIVERMFTIPEIIEIDLLSVRGGHEPDLRGLMLLLPLRSDLGDITRALGCITTSGRMGECPHLFRVGNIRVSPIEAGKPTRAPKSSLATPQTVTVPSPGNGFAESPAGFDRKGRDAPGPRSRGHIRLVVSDGKRHDE
jgi:hypothetical protein